MKKQERRAEATAIEPTIHVGKSGIEAVAEELRTQLKKRTLVKVKILKSAFMEEEKRKIAEKLADLTNSDLIEVRGNTAVFCRKM